MFTDVLPELLIHILFTLLLYNYDFMIVGAIYINYSEVIYLNTFELCCRMPINIFLLILYQ